MATRARLDSMRSLAFGSISGTYAAVGSALTVAPRYIIFANGTAGDVIFSDDSGNAAGKIFVKAGASERLPITASENPIKDDPFKMTMGATWYVKQVTAPTSGSVYISILY